VNINIENSAKQLFDRLHVSGKGRKPNWDIQPENIKDIFRKKVTPATLNHFNEGFYHYGLNLKCLVRGDGSLVFYHPYTERDEIKHFTKRP
jgi:hypothetical protein